MHKDSEQVIGRPKRATNLTYLSQSEELLLAHTLYRIIPSVTSQPVVSNFCSFCKHWFFPFLQHIVIQINKNLPVKLFPLVEN